MLLLGRLPSKIFDFTSASDALGPNSCRASKTSAVGRESITTSSRPYIADLILRLTEGQRLRLSEEVGEEDTVVLGVTNGVVSGCGSKEVSGDEFRSLVDELIERVLAVGTGRTPDNGLYNCV